MASSTPTLPHPLAQLSPDEFAKAKDAIIRLHGPESTLFFRSLYLNEPKRAELAPFLAAEHAGDLSKARRPPRQALIEYDVVTPDRHEYSRAVVNVVTGDVASKEVVERTAQPYFTV